MPGTARQTAAFVVIFMLSVSFVRCLQAADGTLLEQRYREKIQPILVRCCSQCHSGADAEAEVDLTNFKTLAQVRHQLGTWQRVAEMIETRQMPPPDAKQQPSAKEWEEIDQWMKEFLKAESTALAGDPGPVPMRRLTNAELGYTMLDLTGVDLQPAKDFPDDGAAGEGFTNAGSAQAISSALFERYLATAKRVSAHAVLLPDGVRFSIHSMKNDWKDESLARIRAIYGRHSQAEGGTMVNLQGVIFNTNDGGRLPLRKYLLATIVEKDALRSAVVSPQDVAKKHGLNPKYLSLLWKSLNSKRSSPLMNDFNRRWESAKPTDVDQLVARIESWQRALTRFQAVGHRRSWMVPVEPLASNKEFRIKIPNGAPSTVLLTASDAGDGTDGDYVVWDRPRISTPGLPDIALKDLPGLLRRITEVQRRYLDSVEPALTAALEASQSADPVSTPDLAKKHGVDPEALSAWLNYLGIAGAGPNLNLLSTKLERVGGFDFVHGWGLPDTPSVITNASNQHVRVPGNLKPHAVGLHPSPTLRIAAGWKSTSNDAVQISGAVTHAHPECGNGVAWTLELRRGAIRQQIAAGISHGSTPVRLGPFKNFRVRPNDIIALFIGPRDGNHSCDLTDVELDIQSETKPDRRWNLSQDVAGDVLKNNPHGDRLGNAGVWHFFTEPNDAASGFNIPTGSLMAQWQSAVDNEVRKKLGTDLKKLLAGQPPTDAKHPDAILYRQLTSLSGPLLAPTWKSLASKPTDSSNPADHQLPLGVQFGKHPSGKAIEASSLCVPAQQSISFALPAGLSENTEFVVSARIDENTKSHGSVQVRAFLNQNAGPAELTADEPILVADHSEAAKNWKASFAEFRELFPAALCYNKIVPVDEVITLTLFHREDEPLQRLMLSDSEKQELDSLWKELHFITGDALTAVDAYKQLLEYASQDGDPRLFEPFRKPIMAEAESYRQELLAAEPRHLAWVIDFAERAYRRPLTESQQAEFRSLYRKLRQEKTPHDEAIRLMIARVLVSPSFLYRMERTPSGIKQGRLDDWEIASRLSYFLWASPPDQQLLDAAGKKELASRDCLLAQTRRMLKHDKTRRFATEFACQWLHVYQFESLDEKSERHFPTFASLRGDMHQEVVHFAADLVKRDGSLLEFLDCDHTFVNERLAKHYGIKDVTGDHFRRVDGVRALGRGGMLGFAAVLAKQSGASRSSPILRGTWVSEVLLGEKLPKPPKDVPQLPEEENVGGLTVRQIVEKHSSDPRCMVCHHRIDPFGFALEDYDAIGGLRGGKLNSPLVDTKSKLKDGTEINGPMGLRKYIGENRRDAFLRQFAKKLLGYALGRRVQLSDEPLIDEILANLRRNEFRFSAAVETIVLSKPFLEIRGSQWVESR